MAVKRAPITKAYQVNLYCDKCGKRMKYIKSEMPEGTNQYKFRHECECGYIEYCDVIFPYQNIEFDLSKEEDISKEFK